MREGAARKGLKADSTSLTPFEKRVFRIIIFGSLIIGFCCGVFGFLMTSSAWMTSAMFAIMIAILFAFFWLAQASVQSFRDYGLGEGVANLYGEERAKFIFGEDYKRQRQKDG